MESHSTGARLREDGKKKRRKNKRREEGKEEAKCERNYGSCATECYTLQSEFPPRHGDAVGYRSNPWIKELSVW
jgi:hypothetical protein